jgi:hypothetical protein
MGAPARSGRWGKSWQRWSVSLLRAQGKNVCSKVNFYQRCRPGAPLPPHDRAWYRGTFTCWRGQMKVKSPLSSSVRVVDFIFLSLSSHKSHFLAEELHKAITFARNKRFLPGRCHSKGLGWGLMAVGAPGRSGHWGKSWQCLNISLLPAQGKNVCSKVNFYHRCRPGAPPPPPDQA